MLVIKVFFISNDRFLAMHVAMSPNIACVFPSISSSGSMASKREGSKDTDGSATGDVVERVSMSFPIYEDVKLIIEKDIKMKW